MILDLDCGNSTLAWRRGTGPAAQSGALPMDGYADLNLDGVRRVRVCSVRGALWDAALAAHLERPGLVLEFAAVEAERNGLRVAYSDPSRLGADRWLALQAGWREVQGAFAVADLGTAITIDLVDSGGQHMGGWIAPGLGILPTALPDSLPAPATSGDGPWGCSTEAAIGLGCEAMAAGVVRQFHHVCSAQIPLYLCGGDAESLVQSLADLKPIRRPQLVLDGLALVLG